MLEYTEGTLHFTGISTAEGVDLIRKAKLKKLNVTADVHISHLIYNENDVLGFDTNFKVMPPLRFESDRTALWAGVMDGTIDGIASDHRPHDKEEKDLEFDIANFGTLNLQTAFGSLRLANEFNLSTVVNILSKNNRSILNLPKVCIEENQIADLTLFTPSEKWIFTKDQICSNCVNTPLVNKELTGKVVGIINNCKLAIQE